MKNEETARRLKLALNNNHMKAQELADRAKINKASISQYINGIHIPNNISAHKIGEILHVNPLWLMGLSDVMTDDNTWKNTDPKLVASIIKSEELYKYVSKYVGLSDDNRKVINMMIDKLAEP